MSDLISAWVDQDEMRRLAESLLSRSCGQEFERLEVDFGSQFEGFANEAPAASLRPEPESQVVEPGPTVPVQPEVPAPSTRFQSENAPSGPSPSVVRSAVKFLKKAQAEGKAGGVIRTTKPSPAVPPLAPSDVSAVNVSTPPEPEPRPIHSPFRRVSDIESELPEDSIPGMVAAVESSPSGRLRRPPAPSGDDPILARVIQFGKWLKGAAGVRNFFVSNTEGKVLIDEVANPKLIQVARSLASASDSATEGEVGSLHVRIGEDSILEVVPTPSQFGILILGLIVEHPLPEESIREVRIGLEEVANARLIKRRN